MKWTVTIILALFLGMFTEKETDPMEKDYPEWVVEMMDKKSKIMQITACESEGHRYWKVNACVSCYDMMIKVYDDDQNQVCSYGGVLRTNSCKDNQIYFNNCEVVYKPDRKFRIGITVD